MICDLGATTEVSYSKGIESIVFHQLIFSELFIGMDLDTKCGRTIEMSQFENVSIAPNRRFLLVPCHLARARGRRARSFERDEKCQIRGDMVPQKSRHGERRPSNAAGM